MQQCLQIKEANSYVLCPPQSQESLGERPFSGAVANKAYAGKVKSCLVNVTTVLELPPQGLFSLSPPPPHTNMKGKT